MTADPSQEFAAGSGRAYGEDRSSYQSVGPWYGGFGFAKATEADNWTDPTFAANWANLKSEGKVRGAYHFFHPAVSPGDQARHFLSVVKAHGLQPGDLLVADVETTSGAPAADTLRTAARAHLPVALPASAGAVDGAAHTFMRTLAAAEPALAARHHLIVYSNGYVGSLLGSCGAYGLWLAAPGASTDTPPAPGPWQRWQFLQWGFGGGRGGGDRNVFHGTEAELLTWAHGPAPAAYHRHVADGNHSLDDDAKFRGTTTHHLVEVSRLALKGNAANLHRFNNYVLAGTQRKMPKGLVWYSTNK